MTFAIAAVPFAEIRPWRHQLLRPFLPLDQIGDALDFGPDGVHLMARAEGELLGIASIVPDASPALPEAQRPWRVRGVATLPAAQGRGVGRALQLELFAAAAARGGDWVWASARTSALPFYVKVGYVTRGPEYEVPGTGPHYVIVRRLP